MNSFVWHPNTQMNEWRAFNKIVQGNGVYLIDSKGNKMIDGVSSMWCNVWGHSKKELQNAIINQTKKIQHTPLFNLTHEPAEKLAEKLIKISPKMHRVFFSDNGSTAMEVAIKISLQYWKNIGLKNKSKIITLDNGYHGDTFGAMSVGYVPEFFSKFKEKLFSTIKIPVPNKYRVPSGYSFENYQRYCLTFVEKILSKDDKIAALVMESGAQVAGGVIIYPKDFQTKIASICKKNNVLLVLDEIATGFGRLGTMVQYSEQKSIPDIVAYGKMLTGGYMTMGATLTSKKIYDSFLGKFSDNRHLFHGHTFTGNPIAAAVSIKNLNLYKKYDLIKQIKKKSSVFDKFHDELMDLELVGDVRHKGMLMGIELVKNKLKKTPISSSISTNKIIFEEGKRNGVYLRTLGNILMIVPPLAISEKELNLLLEKTKTVIKNLTKKF